jgi:hypothetical protein
MEMLGTEAPSAIARATGLSRQTVYRIKDDPVQAEATLTAFWLLGGEEIGVSAATMTWPINRVPAHSLPDRLGAKSGPSEHSQGSHCRPGCAPPPLP